MRDELSFALSPSNLTTQNSKSARRLRSFKDLPEPDEHIGFVLRKQDRDGGLFCVMLDPELEGKPEAQVVVAVAWRVPVAVRRPAVPGGVVPTAATVHAVRATGRPFGYHPELRITRRRK